MKTVASVLTLPNLLAWARTKSQDEKFTYTNPDECSIAQFLKAEGWDNPNVGPYWVEDQEISKDITAAYGRLLALPGTSDVFTFGQLVTALEG